MNSSDGAQLPDGLNSITNGGEFDRVECADCGEAFTTFRFLHDNGITTKCPECRDSFSHLRREAFQNSDTSPRPLMEYGPLSHTR